MYTVKKFPNISLDEWTDMNRDSLADELSGYRDLFKEESVDSAFQDFIVEHVFLRSTVDQTVDWRESFLRFIAQEVDASNRELSRDGSNVEFYRGRLAVLEDILRWF
jgi:hypothetical protein